MMEKIFNLTSTFKSHTDEDGSVKIRGMASTTDFDRAGDSISADAWTKGGLKNFEKNPIILFNHNYDRPIGRATGLKATDDGLEMEAKISKAAKDVVDLVKDGVLGAFSVGFRVKDADYIEETDGLRIKDAELFEVSVVSVPCNQTATFSLAKSFDSMSEYEDFKKTFTNSDGAQVQKEIQMSEETNQPVDLEAFAKKVAEETAAKIAMKQAEQKAAEEAVQKEVEEKAAADAEAKTQQEEEVKTAIKTGVESGAERLMNDIRKEFEDEKVNAAEVMEKYKKDLEEKQAELEAIQNSKRDFSGRQKSDLQAHGRELLEATVLGKITGKGMDTDFGKNVMQKAGVDYTSTTSAGIDVIVSTQFENEVRQEMKVAPLFRDIQVASGATVLPLAPDAGAATFSAAGVGDSSNQLSDAGDNNYTVSQVILQAHRLIAGTYISNDTDEQVVVTLLPIVTSALARAHAVALDKAILIGASSGTISKGLCGDNGADDGGGYGDAQTGSTTIDASGSAEVTPAGLLAMRKDMGKYGMDPSKVAFIVPNDVYYELIDASGFTDVSEVGNDLATKRIGVVGSVFGSPVVATNQLANNLASSGTPATTAAMAVNVDNYVIPRLKGVSIETEYSVKDQQNVIVAAQSLGFAELYAASGTDVPSVRLPYS
jgi:HK97 family phage prohead protease/HK97 family phage major capsid protein